MKVEHLEHSTMIQNFFYFQKNWWYNSDSILKIFIFQKFANIIFWIISKCLGTMINYISKHIRQSLIYKCNKSTGFKIYTNIVYLQSISSIFSKFKLNHCSLLILTSLHQYLSNSVHQNQFSCSCNLVTMYQRRPSKKQLTKSNIEAWDDVKNSEQFLCSNII